MEFPSNVNDMSNEQIELFFMSQDESNLWPINGRFNATKIAMEIVNDMGGYYNGLEYANILDGMISTIVNFENVAEEYILEYILDYVSREEFLQPYLVKVEKIWEYANKYNENFYARSKAEILDCDDFHSIRCYKNKFFAEISAPGYMDREDIGVFDTKREALLALLDYYL